LLLLEVGHALRQLVRIVVCDEYFHPVSHDTTPQI
jgi:hypothetical protein